MRTTNNLTFEEFEWVYDDHKCPLCGDVVGSKPAYYVHTNPTKRNACVRVSQLKLYLRGIKAGLKAGRSPRELRSHGHTRVIVVNPVEDDDHDGEKETKLLNSYA